jgi:signal transduction histidine kinase
VAVAEEKNITLARAGGPFSVRVIGDEDALLTILGNLLSNAIRYTPEGGEITVRHWSDADRAWVEVKDNGIGMTPQQQAHIFEWFYRAPEARQVESQGMGLGLALVHRLLEALGGRIEVDSSPGSGSVFRACLPLARGQIEAETESGDGSKPE